MFAKMTKLQEMLVKFSRKNNKVNSVIEYWRMYRNGVLFAKQGQVLSLIINKVVFK
jgi:hypothetical protein